MKYAWIQEHRDTFTVAAMCRTLQVSKSGFYYSRTAPPSASAFRSKSIREAVQHVHEQSKGIYGSYKFAEQLQADDQLESACRNTVAAAMQELGLKSKVMKRFGPTTTTVDPNRKPADNLLDQVFEVDQPNRKGVTDISVSQKRRERWEFGLPQSACRSRLQTTISDCG
ncbi:MAG: IS3 family transposase [Planctomycetota bacterium]